MLKFFGIALLALVMDLGTKQQARELLAEGQFLSIVEGRVWAGLTYNNFGAFSLGSSLDPGLVKLLLVTTNLGFLLLLVRWLQRPE